MILGLNPIDGACGWAILDERRFVGIGIVATADEAVATQTHIHVASSARREGAIHVPAETWKGTVAHTEPEQAYAVGWNVLLGHPRAAKQLARMLKAVERAADINDGCAVRRGIAEIDGAIGAAMVALVAWLHRRPRS